MGTTNVAMKRCCRCKQEFPATQEYFSPSKRGKDGLHSFCTPCRRANKALFDTSVMQRELQITDEEKWIVAEMTDRIKARMKGFKEGPCADDVLNSLLPLTDPWLASEMRRHCQLLSLASTMAKEEIA